MHYNNSLKKRTSRAIIFNSVSAQCAQERVEKGVNEFSGAAVMLRKATGFKIFGRKLTTKFPKRTFLQLKLTDKQFFISDFQIVPVKTACHATLPLVKWLPLLPDEKLAWVRGKFRLIGARNRKRTLESTFLQWVLEFLFKIVSFKTHPKTKCAVIN